MIQGVAFKNLDEALDEFLGSPAQRPVGFDFDSDETTNGWTNEAIITAVCGSRGIHAIDPSLYDAVSEKYEVPIRDFEAAFTACAGRDRRWDCFDLRTLQDCCAAFQSLALPERAEDARDEVDQLVHKKGALFTSHDLAWCTPPEILDRVRKIGPIGLDPCGNAQSIVGAKVEWRGPPGKDGLRESWAGYGLVYVNSPYGRGIKRWVAKCAIEALEGVEIIALLPARTDPRWWHESVVGRASTICFWRGRLTFLGAPHGAPFPSAIVYYGDRPQMFKEAFAGAGWIV